MVTTPPGSPPKLTFKPETTYTRDEIHAAVGGSKRSAIPTLDGAVVAVCIRMDLNLRAPQEFLCGTGPVMVTAGNLLASTTHDIPVFTKKAVNQWEYKGLFSVAASHRSGPRFEAMLAGCGRSRGSVSVAVELSRSTRQSGGRA